jgi:viroplasmin and RNaseH domain-containing protein
MAKWYVVFEGLKPGIYTSWHECSGYVLDIKHATYQSYKTYSQAVQEYNDALRMGIVRQVQGTTRADPVSMATSHENEGKAVIIEKPSSSKNLIIVTLLLLVIVLWSRLSNCCSCN